MELKEGMRWDYQTCSVQIVVKEGALDAIGDMINDYAREGWRLHTIQYFVEIPVVYITFERQIISERTIELNRRRAESYRIKEEKR